MGKNIVKYDEFLVEFLDIDNIISEDEILSGLQDAVDEVNQHIQSKTTLKNAFDLLDEL